MSIHSVMSWQKKKNMQTENSLVSRHTPHAPRKPQAHSHHVVYGRGAYLSQKYTTKSQCKITKHTAQCDLVNIIAVFASAAVGATAAGIAAAVVYADWHIPHQISIAANSFVIEYGSHSCLLVVTSFTFSSQLQTLQYYF